MQSPQEFIDANTMATASVPETSATMVPDNLKYKIKAKQPSYYRHHDIVAKDGLTTQAVSTTSTHETVFDVGTSVCNLSRSYVDFHIVKGAAPAGFWSHFYVNQVPWESIELRTKNGTVISSVKNLPYYWKAVCSASLDVKKLMSRGAISNGAINYKTMCHFMNPSNNATGAQLNLAHSNVGALGAATTNTRAPVFSLSDIITSGEATAISINCRVFLSDLAHTIFAHDMNIYSKQPLELAINWAPTNQWGWESDDNVGVVTPRAWSDPDEVPTLTNCYLKLALEQEPDAIAFTKQLVSSGNFKVLIPYVSTYSQAMGAGTSYNFQQRLNSGLGRSLLRCMSACVITSRNSGFNGNFRDSLGTLKVSQHQSFMDTNPLQTKALLHTTNEHFKYVQDLLEDSAIAQSPYDYEIYNLHIDDFSGMRKLVNHAEENRYESGWPLDKELLYNIELTKTAAPTSMFLAAVSQRQLTITSDGVNVSA